MKYGCVYMTKFKRFVSAMLASCMMSSALMMNAGAITDYTTESSIATHTEETNKLTLKDMGHGEYAITDTNDSATYSADTIIASKTDDSTILYYSENQYLVETYNNHYILTDKTTFSADEISTKNLEQFNFSEQTNDEIQQVAAKQLALGNKDFEVEIYQPSSNNDIQLHSNEPIGTNYYQYTYGGKTYKLKDYTVKYKTVNTGLLEQNDSNVLKVSKQFSSIVISAASAASKTIKLFVDKAGKFVTLYELYHSTFGAVKTGSSDDRTYTNLIYDRILKETYVADTRTDGKYILGAITHKIWLNRYDTYLLFKVNGNSLFIQPQLNQEMFSKNFKNPAPAAIQSVGGTYWTDDYFNTTVLGNRILLMGT